MGAYLVLLKMVYCAGRRRFLCFRCELWLVIQRGVAQSG